MNRTIRPNTRDPLAARGRQVVLADCLECAKGIYIPGPSRATCSHCGARMPDALAAHLAAELSSESAAA